MPTLADALHDNALLALPLEGAITLESLTLVPDPRSSERADVVATFRHGASTAAQTSRHHVSRHAAFLELPLDDGARARIASALADVAEETAPDALTTNLGYLVAPAVLQALVPVAPEHSLIPWFNAHGVALVNGGTGSQACIASAALPGGGRVRVVATGLDVSPRVDDYGQLKLTLQTHAYDAEGVLTDVMEAECYSGAFCAQDLATPAPTGGAEQAVVRAWREAFAVRLSALPLEAGRAPHPIELEAPALAPLLGLWLREGPPGPLPQRVSWNEASVARGAAALRALGEDELAALRGEDAFVGCGYALGEWRVLLTAHGRDQEKFWEERVTLLDPAGGRVVVLMGDAWNPATRFVVDADAALFRGFATWLRAVVLAAKLDREIELVDVADDEDGRDARTVERVAVSDWLRFYDRDREREGRVCVDWRIQGDMVTDGTYLDGGPYGFGPRASEEIRQNGVPIYHRFVRDWVDPSFHRGGEPA